ncbi:hypothetical protein Y032_0590g384 [Ancylostoma ceylanicum]|uniref:Uncharacterized protein n=1 Tax=Ancylostoma ceylanicum TaxID=53326 RepID=A0A016WNR3_9BILA|nr:hypothetical protein Y032_0590g384 [Ancylostoma ceylanicum]
MSSERCVEQVEAGNGCNVRQEGPAEAEVKDLSHSSPTCCAVWNAMLANLLKTRADPPHNGSGDASLDSWDHTSGQSAKRRRTLDVWSSIHHGKDAGSSTTLVRSRAEK